MKNDMSGSLEDALDVTRIKLYEQTKGMTTQERVAFFNDRGTGILKRYGIKAEVADAPVVQQKINS
jgi:hypothetical protein